MMNSTELIRDRQRVASILAAIGILSSLLPMPSSADAPARTFPSVDSVAVVDQPMKLAGNHVAPQTSIVGFVLNSMQHRVEDAANQLAEFSVPNGTRPTGQAWTPLVTMPGLATTDLFGNNSDSLVAKAVGSAEGTRQPNGGTNRAYYGHVDPGNAVWNLGTFSYQHCRQCTPEEADRRQLSRLNRQFSQIQTYAQARYNMKLNLEEQLNAIDLANQAPLAALASGGFIDRLYQAKQQGLNGSDAILQARVYSYKNPVTNFWEAPGLGNTKRGITRDQARRQDAIARAIQTHQPQIAQQP
jgi:hypothetical protein